MKRLYTPRELVAPLLIVLVTLLFALVIPSFVRVANYLTILKMSSFAGILSVGMLFVLLTGEIDLSVGAQFAFYGMLCAQLMRRGLPVLLALGLTFLCALLVGLLIGAGVCLFPGKSLLLTIAAGVAIQGLTYIVAGGAPVFGLPQAFESFNALRPFGVSMPVIALLCCGVLGALFLQGTYYGKYLYAVGANAYAAEQSGISVRRTKMMGFSLCSLFVSMGAAAYLGWIGSATFAAGNGMELDVLTAAAIGGVSFDGGKGKVMPIVAGALFMGILSSSFITLNIATYYQNLLKGAILFGAILTNRTKP